MNLIHEEPYSGSFLTPYTNSTQREANLGSMVRLDEQLVCSWVSGGEHHHSAWVLHHLTHLTRTLKSGIVRFGGLADKPYIYIPTYLIYISCILRR